MIKLKLIALLLLFNNATSFACGYHPSGEAMRVCLFSQNLGEKGDEMNFAFYSAGYSSAYLRSELAGPNENLNEWQAYLNHKVSLQAIDELVYRFNFGITKDELEANEMYQYLEVNELEEIKAYILFAKRVENLLIRQKWDSSHIDEVACEIALAAALKRAEKASDDWLQLRYNYQAVVLSFYIADYEGLKNIYFEAILANPTKSILKEWALFYKAKSSSDSNEKLREMALVFEKSRSKNHYIYLCFPNNDSVINSVMLNCETNEQRAVVKTIQAFKNKGKALEQIKEVVQFNPKASMLNVLLVREINKLEDWLFTDRYTGYGSALNVQYWKRKTINYERIDAVNLKQDEAYLLEVIATALAVSETLPETTKGFWHISLAYMYYMADLKKKSQDQLQKADNYNLLPTEKAQIEIITLLNTLKDKSSWDKLAEVNLYEQLQAIDKSKAHIYDYDNLRSQLMLAISRKFLADKNIVMAALFEGKVEEMLEQYSSYQKPSYQVFTLLDKHARSSDMLTFFELWDKPNKNVLEVFLFEGLEKYKWRLKDLQATIYFRNNELHKALAIYKTIPSEVWATDNYDLHYYYHDLLIANPFDTRFSRSWYNDDRSVNYTKPEFVTEILRLKRAVRTTTKNRAYNYMLLGNAYYNMTIAGNSWYYTEYGMGNHYDAPIYEVRKNSNYFTGNDALNYYKLAEKASNNQKFAAFCKRLQYKCINLSVNYKSKSEKDVTQYRKEFEANYPNDYDLLYGCDHFEYYFVKWKDA